MIWNPATTPTSTKAEQARTRSRSTAAAAPSSSPPRPTARVSGSTASTRRRSESTLALPRNLALNANGGDDSFSATGMAALIKITVDGGAGNDTLLGSNGIDILLGGVGNDFADGQQGNDVAFLGAGDDDFQWDPATAATSSRARTAPNDALQRQRRQRELLRGRLRRARPVLRNVANVTMDLDNVETVDVRALGGADTTVVNDLSGTDVTEVKTHLVLPGGGGDGQPDNVVVEGTNGDDVAVASGQCCGCLRLRSGRPGRHRRRRELQRPADGYTVWPATTWSTRPASRPRVIRLTADGGDGDDVLLGGDGDDVLLGGDGDDVLLGGPESMLSNLGGPGDDVEIQLVASIRGQRRDRAGRRWRPTRFPTRI